MLINRILNRLNYELSHLKFIHSKRRQQIFDVELSCDDVKKRFPTLNMEHEYFHHYFWNLAPDWLVNHRSYFSINKRAFGEDAFHAMWYLIFKEFKPKKILEIGIYRGSTLTLFSLLVNKLKLNSKVHGISPFSSAGDDVSTYLEDLDYLSDVKKNFEHFNLPLAYLHKGFSTNIEMVKIIESNSWDLVFIDGNHDYDVAKHDFIVCSSALKNGGLIVFDDASLYVDFKPPFYSSAGHSGPSKVVSEIDKLQFKEILSVGHNRVFKKIV